MKTWLTYLAAAAMGLAFELTLKDTSFFFPVVNFIAGITMKLGIFMVFPLAFFSMSAGTASLSRKRGHSTYVWCATILWSILTSLLLTICAVAIFRLFPVAFPATSTTPENEQQAAAIYQSLSSVTVTRLVSANPLSVNAFINFIKSSDCLLPIIVIAMIFGYAIRPTSEIIRPAYITLNSISEVMFRLARQIAKLLWIAIFFLSATWVDALIEDQTILIALKFVALFGITIMAVLLVILPIIYAILTGFKRNPYRQMIRLLSAGTAALISDNYLFSLSSLYTDCRTNLGIQKSVVGVSLPLHSIVTRGGSAMVSTMCICALLFAINGANPASTGATEAVGAAVLGVPTMLQGISIALACTLFSFISSLHSGYEVVFITTFALGSLGVNLGGAEYSILGILPLINGFAILLDVMLAGLGTSFTACHLKADCHIRARDTV